MFFIISFLPSFIILFSSLLSSFSLFHSSFHSSIHYFFMHVHPYFSNNQSINQSVYKGQRTLRRLGLMVPQPSWRSGFSPSWWSSSSHTSLSCFPNKVKHFPDDKTELPFCFISFSLYELLKKSEIWAAIQKSGLKTHPVPHHITDFCHIQVYQMREGIPSPPRQQRPVRRKGFSNPLPFSPSPTLVISVQETVL